MEGKQEVTDEPEGPPSEHTLDALRYAVQAVRLTRWPSRHAKYLHAIAGMKEPERSAYLSGEWRDEFNLTDEQMKVIGMDVGVASKGAIYVTTWTPEGLRHTEIPTADFYMPDPRGGNIGGNGSEDA